MKSINCLLIIIVFASWGPERSGLVNNIFLSFLKTELIMALVGRRGVSSSDKTKERGGRDRGESQVWPSRSKVTHSRALSIWGRWRVENSGHLTIITQPTTNTTTQGRDGMGTNTRRGGELSARSQKKYTRYISELPFMRNTRYWWPGLLQVPTWVVWEIFNLMKYMAWPNRPHPPSQFSICVKIHLSSTFSLESDPLPKCYHFRKIVNFDIFFSQLIVFPTLHRQFDTKTKTNNW